MMKWEIILSAISFLFEKQVGRKSFKLSLMRHFSVIRRSSAQRISFYIKKKFKRTSVKVFEEISMTLVPGTSLRLSSQGLKWSFRNLVRSPENLYDREL